MKIASVGNRICGSNNCNREAKRKVEFGLGFSAGFCNDCADDLMRQGLTKKVTDIIHDV
jgi:hypothetical protein